ncbi:spermidine synthase [Lacinutrix sp. WUR7]|uniref:spermidine synthase n=1 Tax=Lacinutrix sp. WUR7 TaxID=2653681 RepID=UPI00193CA74C|nr:fused MFS/spermidine synthase [Lacinutrix sp. WUR7]
MKRILSYLWPFTSYLDSDFNGKMEVTWINGKKVLDGQNSNYSYGSLQRILNYSLSKVYNPSISDSLLLGLGGGCVIESLRNNFEYNGQITAIEIDPTIINIATKEFNISESDGLKIIKMDAFNYVAQCKSQYDLIIIDLFIDSKVPEQFYSFPFWETIIPLINPDGYVIFNAGIKLANNDIIDEISANFKKYIKFTKYELVDGTNTILIGKKLPPTKNKQL